MEQPEKTCVVVDDELEINLTKDQLRYMDERKRLGRRSCDPNVTIADREDDEDDQIDDSAADDEPFDESISLPAKAECEEKLSGEALPEILITPAPADNFREEKDNEVDDGDGAPTKSASTVQQAATTPVDNVNKQLWSTVEDSRSDGELSSVEVDPECQDTAFLEVPDFCEDANKSRVASPIDISASRSRRPKSADIESIDENDENSHPSESDSKQLSDVDQLSSKMGRAVLNAQRKQLCQKSFQNCNYLDVGKLRSPNTKQVQSVLRTYIRTASPGKQQLAKVPASPPGRERDDPHLGGRVYPATPPRSGLGRSPRAVVYQSARIFGKPLATPELLASPLPLITIHHRPSPSNRKAGEPQVRINESIYETFEVNMTPRR